MVTIRSGDVKYNLRTLSDDDIDTIIRNSKANMESLNRFLLAMVNERVRRGLRLPDNRQDLDD